MKYLAISSILSLALIAGCAPSNEPESAASAENAPATPTAAPNGTRGNPFMGHGVIREVNVGELVIEHETIPGFMAGMTMAFPVAGEVALDQFQPGDEIMFHIELLGEGYQVFEVSEMGSAQ